MNDSVDRIEGSHAWETPRCSSGSPPDHAHDDDDGDELKQHAQAHEMLRPIGIAAAQHVEKAEKQDDGDSDNGYRHKQIDKTGHRDSMRSFGRPWPEPIEETRGALTLASVSAQQPLEIFEFFLCTVRIAQLAPQFLQDLLGALGG